MPAGTIYMYYARGGDSFNISAAGKGNTVLIKSAVAFLDDREDTSVMLQCMLKLNPLRGGKPRQTKRLLSGQTLLCKALNLKVCDWDQQQFNDVFYIVDVGYTPNEIIQTTRLGIPKHRDPDLPYRFIDKAYAHLSTKNPLTVKK